MLTVDSRLENVPLIISYVIETAKETFSITQLNEIEQALAEALTNCIKHAYNFLEQCPITTQCTLLNDRLLIEIIDQGKAFDVQRIKNINTDFNYDPSDIENLPENGLGLKIIKHYMDDVSYRRENEKNHWLFTKYYS